MMSNFDAGNWIAEQALTLPQVYIIEGVPFDLLSLELDDALLVGVKGCESYSDMVLLAADSGLAYYDANDDAYRVADNKHLSKKIKSMWDKDELQVDTEPCMKERVGLKVCEISGLTEYVEEQRKLDVEIKEEEDKRVAEAKKHLKAKGSESFEIAEHLIPSDTELGNMTADQLAQHHKDNAEI